MYCNNDFEKSIAISIAKVLQYFFHQVLLLLYASTANNTALKIIRTSHACTN